MAGLDPTDPQLREKIVQDMARRDGYNEGLQFGLDWLERRYTERGPKQPERGSPEGKALLILANELAKAVRDEKAKLDG